MIIADHLRSLFPHFDKARVVVVGDVYLDEVSLGRTEKLLALTFLDEPRAPIVVAAKRYYGVRRVHALMDLPSSGAAQRIGRSAAAP